MNFTGTFTHSGRAVAVWGTIEQFSPGQRGTLCCGPGNGGHLQGRPTGLLLVDGGDTWQIQIWAFKFHFQQTGPSEASEAEFQVQAQVTTP